jgi:hypothetical protein
MAVTLRGFSLDVLVQLSPSESDPKETVKAAVRRYLEDRTLRPPGWTCLPLPEESPDDEQSVEIELDEALLKELVAEAVAQKVSLDALVSHAVMYASAAPRAETQAQGGTARRRATGRARSDSRSRT